MLESCSTSLTSPAQISSETLLDRALTAEDRLLRRQAFVELVGSDEWRQVLAPHVISRQGYMIRGVMQPDWRTFQLAAEVIAANEDKVQRCLELAGARFSNELLFALAQRMRGELVEPALEHLRTAEGPRAQLLQRVLQQADPTWVRHPLATRVIRRQLRAGESQRVLLLRWLGEARALGDYLEELHQHPPVALEEWSALGKAGLSDETLVNRALAYLAQSPGPLLYLLRLTPVPEVVGPRILAAARAEWVISALEIAITDGLGHPLLIPLAEIGVRLGGRCMATATAWIGSTRLVNSVFDRLVAELKQNPRGASELLWIRRFAPSADRGLEAGRRGKPVDPADGAALVRQLRGDKIAELVTEILSEPRETMMQPVLRLLCATYSEAARTVQLLCRSVDPRIAARAKEACAWPDVLWPSIPTDDE